MSVTTLDFQYDRRRPEKTLLYKVISENMGTFFEMCEESGSGLPRFVKKEFENYLECGIPAYGFIRVKCEDCKKEEIVPFSCKGRGICPCCNGRRMNETAVNLVDEVLPYKDLRQWVISFPHRLRYLMSTRPKMITKVLKICIKEIEKCYKAKAKKQYKISRSSLKTGSVTLVQRFGSALNLNVHFHILFMDGVFTENSNKGFVFYKNLNFNDDDIKGVIGKIVSKVLEYLKKEGFDGDYSSREYEEKEPLFSSFQSGSVLNKVSIGENSGKSVRTIGNTQELGLGGTIKGKLCVHYKWFSLHAATYVKGTARGKIEKLVRYVLRPSIAPKRLIKLSNGDLSYELKNPWSNGQTHIILSPLEFMEKISSLIPPPRSNIIRFHGVLAPNSKDRSKVVLKKKDNAKGKKNDKKKSSRISWAKLLKRVFMIDVLKCPYCENKSRKIVAAIQNPESAKRYLRHAGIDSDPPYIHPARNQQLSLGF